MKLMSLLIQVKFIDILVNQHTNFEYYCKLIDNMNNIEPTLIFERFLTLKETLLKFYQNKDEFKES